MISLVIMFGALLVASLFNLERRSSALVFLVALVTLAGFLGYTIINEVATISSAIEVNIHK